MIPSEKNPRLDRVNFELRATGIKSDGPNPLRSGVHTRGFLPHVKREGARYFVTFRLADSLPKAFLLKFRAERAQRLHRLNLNPCVDDSAEKIERDHFRKFEHFLDTGRGECWLKRPALADLVAEALRFFDGTRYHLHAWLVMPNHVHVVFWPMPNETVSAIVQSWKRFTAREANKLLKKTGDAFWQRESYDHWIRNDEEHARCCSYVVNNPVKARLCVTPDEWKWSSAWRAEAPTK